MAFVTSLSGNFGLLPGFSPQGPLMRIATLLVFGFLAAATAALFDVRPLQAQPTPATARNVVIFVADGLRARAVNDATAPNMAALARQGVALVNSHAMYPTLTMANASAIATGHYLGDTGVFANTLNAGYRSE